MVMIARCPDPVTLHSVTVIREHLFNDSPSMPSFKNFKTLGVGGHDVFRPIMCLYSKVTENPDAIRKLCR
jgi:hypothetical protein